MTELLNLKTQRTVTRRKVTALLNKASTILTTEPISKTELEKTRHLLKLRTSELKDFDQKIVKLLTDESEILEEATHSTTEYHDKVDELNFEMERELNNLNLNDIPTVQSMPQTINNFNTNANAYHDMTIRLPKYEAKKYDGNPLEWADFWGNFELSIDNNTQISTKAKLVYLKSYLQGEAENVVKGLPITEDNYEIVKNLLIERFGRNDILLNAHLGSLRNLIPVKRFQDVAELKKLYDKCEGHVRGLQVSKMSDDAISAIVCPLILGSIPTIIALEFCKKYPTSLYNCNELLDFIRTEILHRQKIGNFNNLITPHAEQTKTKYEPYRKPFEKKSTAAVLTTRTHKCIFCVTNDHSKETCPLSITERKDVCKKHGRCFRCLETKHLSRNCTTNIKCEKCKRYHNTLLCDNDINEKIVSNLIYDDEKKRESVLPTLLIHAKKGNELRPLQCLIDTGSHKSFILNRAATDLKLRPTGVSNFQITTFENKTPITTKRNLYNLSLTDPLDFNKSLVISVLDTPWITQAIKIKLSKSLSANLKKNGISVNLHDENNSDICLLIGVDHYGKILTGNNIKLESELWAVETIFGWTLTGCSSNVESVVSLCTRVLTSQVEKTDTILRNFWELEAIGIQHESDIVDFKDNLCQKKFRETISFKNGRYEVSFPWIIDREELATNYRIAEKRFWNLVRKFKKYPGLYASYKKYFDEQLAMGIIEKVPNPTFSDKAYYIPHRPVIREERSTTKIRIVYDASSKDRGELSLNECLETGPNLLPEILKLLVLFREHLIAYLSDIEKAFLQLGLNKHDRDYVRFFWVPSDWNGKDFLKPQIMRQKRLVFGATSSPYLLNDCIKYHLEKCKEEFPETVYRLENHIYVDDLIDSVKTKEEVIQIFHEAREIMGRASLPLHKWISNSKELRNFFNEKMPSNEELLGPGKENTTVLGLIWNFISDTLSVEIGEWLESSNKQMDTKRAVIQTVARIFDPLGFAAPFTIIGKILFQDLWKRKCDWDMELPIDMKKKWNNWFSQIQLLRQIQIPRPYSQYQESIRRELHLFCDASPRAYGVVAYVRTETTNNVEINLCASKSRVAPLKPLTLPRLELMSALLLSRLAIKLSILRVDRVVYWTDSSITYFWIKEHKRKAIPFVSNRVREICSNTNENFWQHCPGKSNPADKLTRGLNANELLNDMEWWNGPAWLKQSEVNWPNTFSNQKLDIDEFEEKQDITVGLAQFQVRPEPLLDPAKYSSWNRLIRITAWIKRFIFNSHNLTQLSGPIGTEEIFESEKYWILFNQGYRYGKEIYHLRKGRKIPNDSILSNVTIILDEMDILRLDSRIRFASRDKDFINPIVLDPLSPLTHLIITDCHRRTLHGGLNDTLSEFKARFWTPQSRKNVKKIVTRCVVCRRINSKLMKQTIGLLPFDRINQAEPFEITGIDFAGPLYLKDGIKSYITLFTCAVTRAVHLELVSNMSTECFILAFKRFASRRCYPRVVYSDNAKTFKRAEKDLCLLLNSFEQEQFQGFITERKIKWKFIVELAPWWGGFWERMIKTVKITLKKVLGRITLNFEELSTVLAEVEAVINSRPITYVGVDPFEREPLTPSHFLVGKRSTTLPDIFIKNCAIEASTKKAFVSRWKQRQHLLNLLWRRWTHEYLVELREYRKISPSQEIKLDDVVLIEEIGLPRLSWKIARVSEVFIGRDGRIRSCELTLPDGKTLKRPIQRLCLLEVSDASPGV